MSPSSKLSPMNFLYGIDPFTSKVKKSKVKKSRKKL